MTEQIPQKKTSKPTQEEIAQYSVVAQNSLEELFKRTDIDEIYYIDDIFEIDDDLPKFSGKIKFLLAQGKKEELKKKINEINFDVPDEALDEVIKEAWIKQKEKRHFLSSVYGISEDDADLSNDLKALTKIEEFLPKSIKLNKLKPSEWKKLSGKIIEGIPKDKKALFLFDNIFTHSPSPFNISKGEDLITELLGGKKDDKIICGLITHTVLPENELLERKRICAEKNIGFENFFLISKKRTGRALQFADGIKKALLNSHCEIIKQKTIEIIAKAQSKTLEHLQNIDAYAFDHIVIQSSFIEGIWEPETILRINDFLFRDYVKKEIIADPHYRNVVNEQLINARAIGRIAIGKNSYDDPHSLRNQEIYEEGSLLNELNSPIENGDIFEVMGGNNKGKYILIGQQCDLIIRNDEDKDKDGCRSSQFGALLKIESVTESSLSTNINRYYEKDPLRQHYFSAKYNLPYFEKGSEGIKNGIVDFDKIILIDLSVLDLAVFNSNGECKLDFNKPPESTAQLQSSWRKRLERVFSHFDKLMNELETCKGPVDTLNPHLVKEKVWNSLMPSVSFIDKIGAMPSYDQKVFDFGIKRIMRYREPGATLLLNRYMRYLSREAEAHDFAS